MSEKKKSNWIEKMKNDSVLKSKSNNVGTTTMEFKTPDGLLYSFVSLILSLICCFANQLLHFFVFKETFGLFGSFVVGLLCFFLFSCLLNNVEKKAEKGELKKDILVMLRIMFIPIKDIFYFFALKDYIPFYLLISVIACGNLLYIIFNLSYYERCGIFIYSVKNVLLQLALAYSLYHIVNFGLFISIVSCVYLVLLIQNASGPAISRAVKKDIEKSIEKDINSKFGDKVKVEVTSVR